MTAMVGREISFRWGSDSPQNEIAGVREKGIQLNGDAINITSDDDGGWRKLLDVSAEDQVNINISGVTKDKTLKTDWFAKTRTKSATIEYPDGSTITGTFYLASYNETGTYNDATTFQAALQSTGVITFTPGA